MAFTESASEFIDTDDFGVAATLEGTAVTVVPDSSTFFEKGIETATPIVVGAQSDLGSASKGDTLIHSGITYTVAEPPMNDGLLTTLILRNA